MAYTSFAVVGLETTGNQPRHNEIMQIGITLVRDNKISGTYHSMVHTDLEIPPFIRTLTSIERTILEQAPYFHEIADDVYEQLKDCIFVVHNINFDLNFIKKTSEKSSIHFKLKEMLDTLELFKVAFPAEKSYRLSELANVHNMPLTNAHQTDKDATMTAYLMIKAFKKFESLLIDTLKQLYYLNKHLKYDLFNILFEMVKEHHNHDVDCQYAQFEQIIYKRQQDLRVSQVEFKDSLKDLYLEVTTALELTYHPQQLYSSEIILERLMHNDKALIEAPLGSSGSLAYLLATLVYNIETGKHVMILTSTGLPQYQLLQKDIPSINRALDFKINATLVKSKTDYISLELISQVLKDDTTNYEVNILRMQLLI